MIYGVGKVNYKLTILDSMYASSSSPAKASLVSCRSKEILQEVEQVRAIFQFTEKQMEAYFLNDSEPPI